MKKVPLYIQILVGLLLGVVFAIVSSRLGLDAKFTANYIKPFGTIFLNGLKIIAIPLIFSSLVVGITNIGNTTKLSRIGGKTFLIYIATTIIAVSIGILVANIIKPGHVLSAHTKDKLMALYSKESAQGSAKLTLKEEKKTGPLEPFVKLLPENLISTMSSNLNLLQVVIISIIFGIAILKIPSRQSKVVISFFNGINEIMMEIVRMVMCLAPIGVFSLVAATMVEVTSSEGSSGDMLEILHALIWYVITTLLGLAILTFVLYPMILKLFTKVGFVRFFKGIAPAQLVALTTSSSSASLPVTMERVEKHLGVSEEISSFVLPLGATVNMDGTALYQGVAILFIAQILGLKLTFLEQFSIVANVTISSIGVAGVPGAAMVTTMMILETIGIPAAGLSLILVPERLLDMFRTVANITGDATVAVTVASSEGELDSFSNTKFLNKEDY